MEVERNNRKDVGDYDIIIRDLYKDFKVRNFLFLRGSASDKNLYYFGDFDLYTNLSNIDKEQATKEIIEKHKNIIKNKKNLFFIELKYQFNDGKKIKIFNSDKIGDLDNIDYKDIDFIKFDYVIFDKFKYYFKELTAMYNFKEANGDDVNEGLEHDIDKFEDEGNYWKVLKRTYSYLLINNPNSSRIKEISKFFNSHPAYNKISILEAILKLLESETYETLNEHDKKYIHSLIVNVLHNNDLDVKEFNNPNYVYSIVDKMKAGLNKEAKVFHSTLWKK